MGHHKTDLRRLGVALGVAFGFVLGACFDGLAAEGLPCETDAQCGPNLTCEDKFCGGVVACLDGAKIDVAALCDGTPDCADESDEYPATCGFPTPNQCESEPDQPLTYVEGPRYDGAADGIKIVADNFVDGGRDDLLIAGAEGKFVKIISFGMGPETEAEYFLNGDPPSFGTRSVADFDVADLEGDGDRDIVVITHGDGVGVHVFENDGMNVPAAYGLATALPLDVTVRGMALGRFNMGDQIDLVAIVDGPANKGQVFTAVGDSIAAESGGSYFAPEFSMVQLDYVVFLDSIAADIDDDGDDDLIVTGANGDGPRMWIVLRDGAGVSAWVQPQLVTTPGAMTEIGVGFFGGPGDDGIDAVAILDGQRLLPLLNSNGNFVPGPIVDGFGSGLSDITIADINCDNLPDWLVNVADPAEVRIFLGNGQGGILSDIELTIPSAGIPQGGLAVSQFDQDQTWDIAQAIAPGGSVSDPELRLWFTSDPMPDGEP